MKKTILSGLIAAVLSFPVLAMAGGSQSQLEEAKALRAAEFSPREYQAALASAAAHDDADAERHAAKAIEHCLLLSKEFTPLVESRDRMQLAHAEQVRKDLAERAEEAFDEVVDAIEDDNLSKAKQLADNASLLTRQAEIVAAREQLSRPLVKAVSDARKVGADIYAPKLYASLKARMHNVDKSIRENPAAQAQSVIELQKGLAEGAEAIRIGSLGSRIKKDPAQLENMFEKTDADMQKLAALTSSNISPAQSHAEQAKVLANAIRGMQNRYQEQLDDANKQLLALNGNIKELDEVRFKLNQKREAEAKIAQLVGLFDPAQVEILLSPNADVIIRLKALNFRSGSAVIPPESFELLEQAGKAIALFADRAVIVEGHTDSIGTSEFNQELSERRASTVREYFEALFQDTKRTFTSVGYGEEKPIASNDTDEGRRKNRRIDIVLTVPSMQHSLPD